MKTNKSKLMHELEKFVTTTVSVSILCFHIRLNALVWMFRCTGLTYNEFANDLLKYAVVGRSGSKRIDIVFDVY